MQKRTKILLASATAGILGLATIGGAVAGHKQHKRGWGMHGGGHGMQHRVKKFVKRYDANKDGEITQQEIDTNRTDWHKKFDTDGNGTLSLTEFGDLWLEAKRRRMVRAFQHFDEDGSGTVTLDEYTEPLSRIVERMDRNGDGVLSRKDRRRHSRKQRMHGDRDGRGDGQQRMDQSDETGEQKP